LTKTSVIKKRKIEEEEKKEATLEDRYEGLIPDFSAFPKTDWMEFKGKTEVDLRSFSRAWFRQWEELLGDKIFPHAITRWASMEPSLKKFAEKLEDWYSPRHGSTNYLHDSKKKVSKCYRELPNESNELFHHWMKWLKKPTEARSS
jgi:hypothetical protein